MYMYLRPRELNDLQSESRALRGALADDHIWHNALRAARKPVAIRTHAACVSISHSPHHTTTVDRRYYVDTARFYWYLCKMFFGRRR